MKSALAPGTRQAEHLPQQHPFRAQLVGFLRGELPRPEVARIVRHLLTGCNLCVGVTRRLWDLGEGR